MSPRKVEAPIAAGGKSPRAEIPSSKAKAEAEARAREEAERKTKAEAEARAKEERERKAAEEERKAKEEAAKRKAASKQELAETDGPLRVGSVVKAKYKYAATRDDELSFKKGDLIEIVELDPKGKWHSGRLASAGGKGDALKFPANYI